MHSEVEHILICLVEECNEIAEAAFRVSTRASKSLRFGLEEVEPQQLQSNVERLTVEINDFLSVVERLDQKRGIVQRNRVDGKHAKLDKFIRYASDCGTIENGTDWLGDALSTLYGRYVTTLSEKGVSRDSFIAEAKEVIGKEAPGYSQYWITKAADEVYYLVSDCIRKNGAPLVSQIRKVIEREYFQS